jgi:hypothetical protein
VSTTAAQRILLVHPIVTTVVFLIAGALWLAVPLELAVSGVSRAVCVGVYSGLTLGWVYAVYSVAVTRIPGANASRWMPLLFVATPTIAVISELAGISMENTAAALVSTATLCFALWQAAHALEAAVVVGRPPTTGQIIRTMILMYFTVVGVWALSQKIDRVATGPI